jgi:hypothetical protein
LELDFAHRRYAHFTSDGLSDQRLDQSGDQGFLPCPKVVCTCGFGFSAGAPLSGSAGLESLSSLAVRYPGSESAVCSKFREKVFFQGNLCYHADDEKIRLQEQNLWGIFSGPKGLKKQFLTAVVRAAA